MQADGGVVSVTLAEGQRAVIPAAIAKGGCATFIAQGGLGVVDVDLFLTRAGDKEARVLAQDPPMGPIAVIGGRGKCFQGADAIDGELHVVARRGEQRHSHLCAEAERRFV